MNSTSDYGFVLFGDTHSKQGIHITKSGKLPNGTIVGGNVYSNITGIEVDGNISAYNIGMTIGGIISPDIKEPTENESGELVEDSINAYKGI